MTRGVKRDPRRVGREALQRAIGIAGGQRELAAMIGTYQNSVYRWLKAGKPSPRYVELIREATGVPIYQLRPDLYRDRHDRPKFAGDPEYEARLDAVRERVESA